ncbi:uncharacterized protein B0I36DRAFT_327009 [Microdochium trichocladiopsis]|uniref:Acetylserotonin methytransferase-like protein n=1 Tax=Microdochium trichocladiopsis TaxID=1682393 RepID=A0A9P8Y201_9PEZI|nr:uncharacterized protein B0I36DRAFT_327009 [Microdochium trichocladiopsis]KAH7027394.1 hypothetical protein B0I36DRAFT_327009 [Microdochium trichocladiopsis]
MANPAGPSGGFSLFPNTSGVKPPSRKTTPVGRPKTPPGEPGGRGFSFEQSPQRNGRSGRRTPEDGNLSQFVIDGSPSAADHAQPSRHPIEPSQGESSASRPAALPEYPPRSETAFSGATLVRSGSNRSRSSIAKRPLEPEDPSSSSSPQQQDTGLRSIFPQYDHTVPMDRQEYFPTQVSPRHIPRTVISRQENLPPAEVRAQSPPVASPLRSPLSMDSTRRWPRRNQEPPVIPPVSRTEQLRDYWKAANGWKASQMEGRTYCLKLTPEKDTPIYTLSSTTQPLYHLKIDPTSASAYVSLKRHDPSRPCKEQDPTAVVKPATGILGAIRDAESRPAWQEAINTTLEEPSRRLPPNDGLVALLYPCAATKVALDRPDDIQAVAAAERECARLVWDDDSKNYYLVHPALATPFCITIEHNPAWSRTEYTLEHIESPQHLAKLTREGTGDGYMELDTLVAGHIEAYYVLDVAVCALMLVANLDEKNVLVESFEPPPPPAVYLGDHERRSSSRLSHFLAGSASVTGRQTPESHSNKKKTKKSKTRARMEELELDLESQTSSVAGGKFEVKDKHKLPSTTRTVIKLIGIIFKLIIWILTVLFKAVSAIVVGLSKCITSDKL